ncbi:hypothetical protein J8281_01615 [Aquimarina sp. U1-2]|uniref:hypothetical protein n=1 Tax=Aquimarina sp. U1-2 TaxID=2823141 RepID=UPI001AECFF91|nr:hypothetical protein [Aquimarina sp. U1-2]MBP2830869.1 hypothetical protein [Aquimarina sp. U1-2]
MPKFVFSILFFTLITVRLCSQEKLTWSDFADVKFSHVYSAVYDDIFLKPKFGTIIQSYEGARIRIKGYFLDFSIEEDEFYLLSQNPRASCFFCGGAGPESVVEVVFKQKPAFRMDQIVEVTGVLELNIDDVDHCNYILKEATGRLIQ